MNNLFRAAAGKVGITPEESAPLQGYDPELYVADPARHSIGELFARVLIMDSGTTRSLIVSVDCCLANEEAALVPHHEEGMGPCREFVPTFPAGTRARWAHAAGVREEAVSVHATHTHSAPAQIKDKYCERISRLIEQTGKQLQPVTLHYSAGTCTVSANRRPHLKPNFDLPIDSDLQVLAIHSLKGEPIAIVVNAAVHPTMVSMVARRVSADLTGYAMEAMERQFGGKAVSLFIQGFSGEICPLRRGFDEDTLEEQFEHVPELGQQLYEDAARAMERMERVETSPHFSVKKTIRLPTRSGFVLPEAEMTLAATVIGDLVLLAASGEIFSGMANRIKSLSPFRHHLLAGVANGYSGYLPTTEAFRDGVGGYEMTATPYSEEAAEVFVREAEVFLHSLKADTL
ncbi:hypothetical protein [Cohnella silvisoli]|uniref:Uncharacterized protein n=1 Tax=Cohnella silvisoli TaxID=2873699 RepID=A0ABV1L0I7_9BACL|nr:hypothetical protein [Cohnella silvisoli]MCD9025135.1 hypothetical protein [Cohnella silvisoli]